MADPHFAGPKVARAQVAKRGTLTLSELAAELVAVDALDDSGGRASYGLVEHLSLLICGGPPVFEPEAGRLLAGD